MLTHAVFWDRVRHRFCCMRHGVDHVTDSKHLARDCDNVIVSLFVYDATPRLSFTEIPDESGVFDRKIEGHGLILLQGSREIDHPLRTVYDGPGECADLNKYLCHA